MSLFKKSHVEDERITNIKNKIYAEIFILVIVICGISSFVKCSIYDMGIENIVTELSILFISGVYYIFRSTRLGVISAEVEMHDRKSKWPKKKKNVFFGIALGVAFALFFGINSAVRYAEGVGQSIYYFFLVATVSLIIYLPFFLIILVVGHDAIKEKSDEAMNNMLDDNESGDDDEKY